MPVAGNRKSTNMGRGYQSDPIMEFASKFRDVAQTILDESGADIYSEPKRVAMNKSSNDTLKQFFVENSCDRNDFATAAEYEDHIEMMAEQYENDREAMLEYSALGEFNPVIGMAFPLHKNLLMNNIFDKGAIQKVVAREPKFTISMESRFLIAPDGTEIDMFLEQNKMTSAIDQTAPFKEVELALPELETTNVLTSIGATDDDNLSIETHVSAVKMSIYLEAGDINPETGVAAEAAGAVDVWLKTKGRFTPGYGDYDRTLMHNVNYTGKALGGDEGATVVPKVYDDILSGFVKKNKFIISSAKGVVKAIKLKARIDTSSAMVNTASVTWRVRTDIVEIPSANPINITISPEEVKDIGALYQVNQLSKIMSMLKLTLGNYKDDKILQHLNESYVNMPANHKLAATFDFAPPKDGNYAFDHIEWRHKTFMDALDTHVTFLLQVLNDPNMTITIFGRPDLIRKITPTEYTYQTPSSIGPVELDFVKTVTTSDKRVYQFIASDKLRNTNNLIIILNPRNTERIIYRIYDYQLYVSNEIRNVKNYALPAVHAFERWKFMEYQSVQGRLKVLNPTGQRTVIENSNPVEQGDYNEFTSNAPTP